MYFRVQTDSRAHMFDDDSLFFIRCKEVKTGDDTISNVSCYSVLLDVGCLSVGQELGDVSLERILSQNTILVEPVLEGC